MARVLFIGGTGEISFPCVEEAVRIGHDVTVFNRGHASEKIPAEVSIVRGDLHDAQAYRALAGGQFDVVCQFVAFDLADIQRDVTVFAGHCSQYVFISTASAYEKPPQSYVITEETPLKNPYWVYSQQKADMESHLMDQHRSGRLNVTIVRPSHTVRKKFPGGIVRGDDWAWRLQNHKPILIHGDGTALWTLTHASDFVRPICKTTGEPRCSWPVVSYHTAHGGVHVECHLCGDGIRVRNETARRPRPVRCTGSLQPRVGRTVVRRQVPLGAV